MYFLAKCFLLDIMNLKNLPAPHLLKIDVDIYDIDKVLKSLHGSVQTENSSGQSDVKFNVQNVGPLYAKHMESLSRPDYINDNIINAFVQTALHNCQRQRHGLDVLGLNDILFIDPLFISSLNTTIGEGFAHRAVKECWLAKQIIVMPYCTDQHWRLCIVNKKTKHILFMDSLHGEVDICMLEQFFTFIAELPKHYPTDTTLRWLCEKWCNSEWECLSAKDFKLQVNNYDCGIYVIVWISLIIDSYDIRDTPIDVYLYSKYLRSRIFGIIIDSELTETVNIKKYANPRIDLKVGSSKIVYSAADPDYSIFGRTTGGDFSRVNGKERIFKKFHDFKIRYTTVYPYACSNSWQYLRKLKTENLF
uniref:Sentrin-specific protease 1 n=1 Tax=Glypta fumiferanae TaxID=389681 RepID=A0A0F6Q732_9HYME|nr:sentrin-specific protease 1 [Glypta fumiferanae]